MSVPEAIALIPARYASTRLPGKPLLAETGKPLIQHVVEQALQAKRVDHVAVATDDTRIADAVTAFGGQAVMTGEHPNGTSRLAEALTTLNTDHELIVNIQGDEPEINPAVIDALIDGLAADPDAPMATLCSRFGPDEDPNDPNLVKVVKDQLGRALYFSRARIPYDRDGEHPVIWKHPGLYAYRRDFLLAYPALTPTPLEQAEQLEQLRVLEHGHRIALIEAQAPHPGIDTRPQYDAFVARYQAQT